MEINKPNIIRDALDTSNINGVIILNIFLGENY